MTVATFTATIQQKNRENFYDFLFEGSLSHFFKKINGRKPHFTVIFPD
jgi:hypothetical protein